MAPGNDGGAATEVLVAASAASPVARDDAAIRALLRGARSGELGADTGTGTSSSSIDTQGGHKERPRTAFATTCRGMTPIGSGSRHSGFVAAAAAAAGTAVRGKPVAVAVVAVAVVIAARAASALRATAACAMRSARRRP